MWCIFSCVTPHSLWMIGNGILTAKTLRKHATKVTILVQLVGDLTFGTWFFLAVWQTAVLRYSSGLFSIFLKEILTYSMLSLKIIASYHKKCHLACLCHNVIASGNQNKKDSTWGPKCSFLKRYSEIGEENHLPARMLSTLLLTAICNPSYLKEEITCSWSFKQNIFWGERQLPPSNEMVHFDIKNHEMLTQRPQV